jgi:periodic tryptophan protein 2
LNVNASGEWLAFASGKLGQLLVWEWQSESYVLKQQGHFYDMNTVTFSPNGQLMATGGDDGKLKLWNTSSGFCVVTFPEHIGGHTPSSHFAIPGSRSGISPPPPLLPADPACPHGGAASTLGAITGVKFIQNGLAVLSASLDGTVRAFDTTRYRNFRTMTSPQAAQACCRRCPLAAVRAPRALLTRSWRAPPSLAPWPSTAVARLSAQAAWKPLRFLFGRCQPGSC